MQEQDVDWLDLFAADDLSTIRAELWELGRLKALPMRSRPQQVAVMAYIASGSMLLRMCQLMLLRFKLPSVRRRLRAIGYDSGSTYFLYPDLVRPYLVGELEQSVLQYAQTHLMFSRSGTLRRFAEVTIKRIAGCPPSVAGIVVVACQQ